MFCLVAGSCPMALRTVVSVSCACLDVVACPLSCPPALLRSFLALGSLPHLHIVVGVLFSTVLDDAGR